MSDFERDYEYETEVKREAMIWIRRHMCFCALRMERNIPDGGKIVIINSSEDKLECTCRFIQEYHTEIGDYLYHICQFAEIMECNGNGSTYAPVQAEEMEKEQAETDLQVTDSFRDTWQGQTEVVNSR